MSSSIADLAMLGRLFEEHRVRLETMIDRRLDPALKARVGSQDILQVAYRLAESKWPEFQRRQKSASQADRNLSPFSWLYRISLDALIEVARKHGRKLRDIHREMPLPESSSMQLGCGLIEQGPGPVTLFQQKEVQELVRKAMAKLNDSDYRILWMRHGDLLSFNEISEILGITEDAAGVRYFRAIRRLRKIWHELYPDFGSTL